MSTITVTNIKATGETASRAVSGVAAAWANFTGITTTALRDSVNVSSLTDTGTGATTVTLTNNMANANYTGSWYANVSVSSTSASFDNSWVGGFGSRTTSSYGVHSYGTSASGTSFDSYNNDTVIHGDLA